MKLRIAFKKIIDDFVIFSDDAVKYYMMKIVEDTFYVREMTLNDEVVSAIDKILLTSPAAYHFFETLKKTFSLQMVSTVGSKMIFLHEGQFEA